MSYPCIKCGQLVDEINTKCKKCLSEQTMQKMMVLAILVAVLTIGIIGLLLLQTINTSNDINKTIKTTPTPSLTKTSSLPTPTLTSTPTKTNNDINQTKIDLPIKPDVLENYVNATQPIMSDVRAEMSSTILDIKDFLKNINATKDTKVVRQIIDNFREQMKRHSDKFISLNRSLRLIAPPVPLEKQHEKLGVGIGKYNGAVQGYMNGLAAYNFQQIRTSQTQLEEADKEILIALIELQEAFKDPNK